MEDSLSSTWMNAQDLDLCWRPHDPATSEQILRAKLTEARQPSSKDKGFLLELLTQIARAEAAQGKLTEARNSLNEAEKILNEPEAAYPARMKIRFLLEEGRFFIHSKTPAQARTRFSQAWALAVNAEDDFFTVDIARMMATIEPMKLQIEWIHKAIQIAEQSTQEKARRWLGGLFSDLAWRFFDLRQFDQALEAHKTSRSHFQKHGSEREVFVANWAIGRVLRQLGRVQEALAIQEGLRAQMGAHDLPDGRLFEELAECLFSLKKLEAAQIFFEQAHRELSSDKWIPDRHPLRLKRLKDFGRATGS